MGSVRRRFLKRYFVEIWLLLIASIAVTILALSAFLYKSFESGTVSTVYRYNRESLLETGRINEYVRKMIRTSGMELFSEPSVRRLLYGRKLTNFEALSGIRRLDSAASTGRYIHSIYVYNAPAGYVYSSSDTVSDSLERFEDGGLVELLKPSGDRPGLVPVARYIGGSSRTVPVHSFLFQSTSAFTPDARSALVINVTLDWLREIVRWGSSRLYMLDASGNVLYHDEPEMFLRNLSEESFVRRVLDSSQESGAFVDEVSGVRSLVLHAASGDLFLVRTFPYAEVMGDLGRLRTATALSAFGVLAFGVLVAFAVSRRLYRPIGKLSLALGSVPAGSAPSDEDEVGRISSAIESMVARTRTIEESSRTRSAALVQEVLKEFVQGETLGFPGARELFAEYEVPFDPDGAFWLVAVRPDRADPSLGSTVPQGALNREGTGGPAWVLSVDGVDLAVLQGEAASREGALVQAWRARTSGVVAVSGRLHRADAVPAAFARLRDRIRMGFLDSPGEVARLSDEGEPETGLEYPAETERRILQSLRAGDVAAAEDALVSFLDALSGRRFDPFRFALRRLYTAVLELEREMRPDPGPAGSGLDCLPSEPTSLEEILDPFRTLFNFVREALEEHRAARCRELAEAVRSILQERYTDPNLTLRGIADELGYSSSHVARAFKEGAGSSVADAILEYRLEAAKRLLLEDGCPAKDVAARVGLVNENYFYTLFRKKVGLTPAAFRRGGLQNSAESGNAGI